MNPESNIFSSIMIVVDFKNSVMGGVGGGDEGALEILGGKQASP